MLLFRNKFPLILLVGFTIIAVSFLLLKSQFFSQPKQVSFTQSSVPVGVQSASLTNSEKTVTTSSVHSPDGKMELTMQEATTGENLIYDFSVAEIGKGESVHLYSKTVSLGHMELPFNSWSPDDKYVFVSENTGGIKRFYVFKANGETFSNGEEYIDVIPKFESANTGLKLENVTGWDSENLLHISTLLENGEKGPGFWFEIPSKAIIRLSG